MLEIELDILWEVEKDNKIEELIYKVVEAALKEEKADCKANVSIVITNNEQIQKVNYEHRNKDMATDVLSFPGYEKEEWDKIKTSYEYVIVGDIMVSTEKVVEQAELYGNTFDREFAYLITHGMLHLMGYDHMVEEDKAVMREKEEIILKTLGLSRQGE